MENSSKPRRGQTSPLKWKCKTKVKKVVVTGIKELTKNENDLKTEETDLKYYLNKM